MHDRRQLQKARSPERKFLLGPILRDHVWMNSRYVSNLIGVSVTGLAKMRRNETGPECFKWDGRWMYQSDALIDWLNSRAASEAGMSNDA